MRKRKAFKKIMFGACTALFISLPMSTAHAESIKVEQGVAGIAVSLEKVAIISEDAITQILNNNIFKEEEVPASPLEDKGVSKADNYVNVRKEASTDSEVVGKLYRGCAADILERLEGNWVRIKSGDVEGYIASDYLATGKDAEIMAEEYATKYATVIGTQTLRVREEQSTESKTLELIPLGETFIVVKEYEEWAEILIATDEAGNDLTGFVHKDFIEIEIEFKEAISIEEEQRIEREQIEAERAEAERLQRLAEEEAQRKAEEAARKKAEEDAKKKAAEKANEEEKTEKVESTPSSNDNGSISGTRNEIISYAKKFVGFPYKWGGTSLTGGADCSGFVWRIYKDFGYTIPRVSRDQANGAGIKVDLSDRRPGDLLFYGTRGTVNHVAMYIGNDQVVHASNAREGIKISKYNYREVLKIRRVVY